MTVGCPTAYRFKYKGGGLAKMQLLPSIMPSVGSFSTTTENKAFRVKSLLGEGQEINWEGYYVVWLK